MIKTAKGALALAIDMGGTKTDLGIYALESGRPFPVRTGQLATAAHGSAAKLLGAFLGDDAKSIKAACIGVAGTVLGDTVSSPNLPWTVNKSELKQACGAEKVELLNDLLTTAYGIGSLQGNELHTLQDGVAIQGGTQALIAAGTGLGEALLVEDNGRYKPLPSEGGHCDLALPLKLDVGREFMAFLKDRFGAHVSWERVVSGPGLAALYCFFVSTGNYAANERVAVRMKEQDPSAVISDEALKGTDEACVAAMELFVKMYGAEAGNLALKALSTGGIYIGGGIAPKIIPALKQYGFMEGFRSKGRFTHLMDKIPVKVITQPKTSLIGAASRAVELLSHG